MNASGDLSSFLQAAGWDTSRLAPLPADFSTRWFSRLERDGDEPRRAILMQAARDQKTPQFIAIAELLRRCDLSAPEVYASTVTSIFCDNSPNDKDRPNSLPLEGRAREGGEQPGRASKAKTHHVGAPPHLTSPARGEEPHCSDVGFDLVLMEDFGDTTFGKMLDEGREALPLYRRAVDVLAHLHRTFDPAWVKGLDLPIFNAAVFTAQAELFLDSFFPSIKNRAATGGERESFRAAWRKVLEPLNALPQTLMLRDFMPDNMMDLPERKDWRSVGILDFQDGGLGPIAYDLASLCECVRRDASPALLDDTIATYHGQNPVMPLTDLRRACRVLAAQRHMRVLGILARLAETQGRHDKLAHVPRMMNYLVELLKDDALAPVRAWMEAFNSQAQAERKA